MKSRHSKTFERIRTKFFDDQPVYIPGYEYSPIKKYLLILILIVAFISLGAFYLKGQNQETLLTPPVQINATEDTTKQPFENKPITIESSEKIKPSELTYYDVVKVVDGDTIDVLIDGKKERVRFIGIDTPESVDPRRPVQCYGVESSNYVKRLLSGESVALEVDKTQGDRDRFNRLLRYIYLESGENLAEKMLTAGYGLEYTFSADYKYKEDFINAEQIAKQNELGLWSKSTCNGAVSVRLTPTYKTQLS